MSTESAHPEDLATLYRRAFDEYGARALWSMRPVEAPTAADALAITQALRTHGRMDGRRLAERIEADGIGAAIDGFVDRSFAPDAYRERPELAARLRAVIERTDPRGAAAMLRGIATRVASDDLFAEIDVPVRIVAGTQDAIVPFAFAEAMARGIAGAELDTLACGHVPLYEEAEAVTASLERLLAAPSTGSG